MSLDRGMGLVLLILFVVAPLTFFAATAAFGDSERPVVLSADGVHWSAGLDEPLLDDRRRWWPGQERSAIVYVHNRGPTTVDGVVSVHASTARPLAGALGSASEPQGVGLAVRPEHDPTPDPGLHQVAVTGLAPHRTTPLRVSAYYLGGGTEVMALDDDAVRIEVEVEAVPREGPAAPSLVRLPGALLWVAPLGVVAGGALALTSGTVLRRRRAPVSSVGR